MPMDPAKIVTWDGLAVALKPLEEIRTTLFGRQESFETALSDLKSEVADMKAQITARQDKQNGTLITHTEKIDMLDEEVKSACARVEHLEKFGCAQRAADMQVIERLAGFNMPVLEPPPEVVVEAAQVTDPRVAFVRKVATKQNAKIAALIGLGWALEKILPYLHKLFDLLHL